MAKRCGREPGPQAPHHLGRMPIATDLAELLRQERGPRREPVELRRRDRNAMRAKRQDDARDARKIRRNRLLVRAIHLAQVGLQGLSRSRHRSRRRGRTREPRPTVSGQGRQWALQQQRGQLPAQEQPPHRAHSQHRG